MIVFICEAQPLNSFVLGSGRGGPTALETTDCKYTCTDLFCRFSCFPTLRSTKLCPKCGSHIAASHARQTLVKGERWVRFEANAVMAVMTQIKFVVPDVGGRVLLRCVHLRLHVS